MSIKKKFQGFNNHRLDREALERRFAKAWQAMNDKDRSTLAYLLSHDQHFPAEPSERDWLVANTVIQWLGSSVGRSFLEDVLSKHKAERGDVTAPFGG